MRALAPLNLHADDLGGEAPRRLRRREALLRAFRPTILILARDLAAHHQVFGMPARVLARERVVQSVAQHAVVDLDIAHALTPAPTGHEVRRLIHVFHSTGDGGVDMAEPDLLRRRCDCLRTRAADAINGHRGHGDGNTAVDRGLTRRIHAGSGLDDIAHHHAADAPGIEARAPQRLANHRSAQLGGWRGFQCAVEGPDR